jgi:hypothetical protein
MNLNKLLKTELFAKCDELGIIKYKSKNKEELIRLIKNKELDNNIITKKKKMKI